MGIRHTVMTGTYSSDFAEFLFFGPNRRGVSDIIREAHQLCEKKGLETAGPIKAPTVTIAENDPAFDKDEDALLFGQRPTDLECESLPGETVFRRILRVYNNGEVIRKIASLERPSGVFTRVVVDTRTHGQGGKGVPHTYDPRLDYKSEM